MKLKVSQIILILILINKRIIIKSSYESLWRIIIKSSFWRTGGPPHGKVYHDCVRRLPRQKHQVKPKMIIFLSWFSSSSTPRIHLSYSPCSCCSVTEKSDFTSCWNNHFHLIPVTSSPPSSSFLIFTQASSWLVFLADPSVIIPITITVTFMINTTTSIITITFSPLVELTPLPSSQSSTGGVSSPPGPRFSLQTFHNNAFHFVHKKVFPLYTWCLSQ